MKELLQKIVSVKNENNHKVLRLAGVKFKFQRPPKTPQQIEIKIEDKLDIFEEMEHIACRESAEYALKHMLTTRRFANSAELLAYAVANTSIDGLFCEFGVYSGKTINLIAQNKPEKTIYGFDSFEGLPQDWRSGFEKGYFNVDGSLPEVAGNVTLIKGWFDETLPVFIQDKEENCAFIHVDCDLYSSTKTIFNNLGDKIVSGTIIVFDEYFNYPGWQEHEYKAFKEFIEYKQLSYEYIGYVPSHQQAAVRIL